ncbi:MAG: hypothetical protein R3Y45_07920 [Bacillota bacterium]
MQAKGSFITINNQPFYKISNSQNMAPFFLQVVSACDLWAFMSSKGGITAGRNNENGSIFPYETEDRLHQASETGSKTIIKCGKNIWYPFEQNNVGKYKITQNIYKSTYGNSVFFEEINHDLELSFKYGYQSAEKYGLIKTSEISNIGDSTREIEVLDGLSNIMPHGVGSSLQQSSSTLVDAYKSAELECERLGIYSLTTKINDTPNPIEILKANVCFTTKKDCIVYLGCDVCSAFLQGDMENVAQDAYGKKCGYFVVFSTALKAGESTSHKFVLDSSCDHAKISALIGYIERGNFDNIELEIEKDTKALIDVVKNADGVQSSGDETACAHHYLNTLYNVMRGGTFENGYAFDPKDFVKFIKYRNFSALENSDLMSEIKNCKTISELKQVCQKDKLFYRMALEYMPLSFSRRHGDPSRPWNKFNINLKDENGEKINHYEGNWRDIFQNWEALGLSYPEYYENMVAKFVNATTADGFNPYRINTKGIEWEKPEPDNPFSGYGYWGDHQIVYLHRLLKGLLAHYPQKLAEMLACDAFTYANVPYVLAPYAEILKDSKNTISFDAKKDAQIENLVVQIGSDGKLLQKDGEVYTVCLAEKLLVPLLSKMSNLLVGGGIWMNTQRPEWNDANNAIVGIGLSMVTVYHVKAYLQLLQDIFEENSGCFEISDEVVVWLADSLKCFAEMEGKFEDSEKAVLDELGQYFSLYRNKIYTSGLSNKTQLHTSVILDYIKTATAAIDYTISKNHGEVYSTYNLLKADFTVSKMDNMLEGQSAIIGSGSLNASEIGNLIDNMENSLLVKERGCHTLYPIKKTKRFISKNNLGKDFDVIDNITVCDMNGDVHFLSDITTEEILCERIKDVYMPCEVSKRLIREFESQFGHKKFTGRSQVMYKFEGIGCVYWHQNAKLALAVLEGVQSAREKGAGEEELYAKYKSLMRGFIYRKTPKECGAIPIEPYSHSSFEGKSEQPGMTGQVKESVIMRRAELGVSVKNAEIHFDKWFVQNEEYNKQGEIHFSIYGVPVKYENSSESKLRVELLGGETLKFENAIIPKEIAIDIFARNGKVVKITY